MSTINIIPMEEKHVEEVSEFMAQSFFNDPLYTYFAPEEETRMVFIKDFSAFRLRFAMAVGKVFISDDIKAVAAWIPPNTHMLPEHLQMYGGMTAIMKAGQQVGENVMTYSNFADGIESKFASIAHWHLSPLVVEVDHWGKGYARALIAHMTKYFDDNNDYCYLDTQTDKNREIYEKYGFEIVKTDVIPNGKAPHFAMLRKPKNDFAGDM